MLRIPAPYFPFFVPKVNDAVIGQQAVIPTGTVVGNKHIEPDGINNETSIWIWLQYIFLHPTGARTAFGSGGRHE